MVPKSFRSRFTRAEQAASAQADAEAGYGGVRKLKRGDVIIWDGGVKDVSSKDAPKWRWRIAKKGGALRPDQEPR